MNTRTLAAIAFDLRFANLTEEEGAMLIPAPWSYRNVPQAVRTESQQVRRFGKGEQPFFTEVREWFADGSSFAFSTLAVAA